MTAKELKKLRRSDLLEMLLTLRKENEILRQQLQDTQEQLNNRQINIENSGSLAEAALQLSNVFEAAQTACKLYQDNIRYRMEQQELETQKKCAQMLEQARQETESYSWLKDVMEENNIQKGL